MLAMHRTALRRRLPGIPTPKRALRFVLNTFQMRFFSLTPRLFQKDPRIPDVSPEDETITDDFAQIRAHYDRPKHPIVLAHGLFGFDELHPAGIKSIPGIQYWYGIKDALQEQGIEVWTAHVQPFGSIEERAQRLARGIEEQVKGKKVNIIAGLDARYMISHLNPPNVEVLSLTTISTPHRGSTFADYLYPALGPPSLPFLYKALNHFGLETGAFRQLTKPYMTESFNPRTPDREDVAYYSYGASLDPGMMSLFNVSGRIVAREEGGNDGLVSVESARWGQYQGTLEGVSHLDLINWTNRLRWYWWRITGRRERFNAIALYLDIAEMLAKEGH